VSFWESQARKRYAAGHQADIGKTFENHWYLVILESWRLGNAVSGSLWKLVAALGFVIGWLDGWLRGWLLLFGRLVVHRDPRS
jgi:hypothetical protein